MSSECSVDGALALNLRISRVCCIAPVKIISNGRCSLISVSGSMSTYSYTASIVALLLIINGLIVDIMVEQSRVEDLRSNASHIVYQLAVVKSMIIMTLATMTGPKRIGQLIDSLNKVNEIYTKLTGLQLQCRREKRKCILSVIWYLYGVSLASTDIYLFWRRSQIDDMIMKITVMIMMILFYIQHVNTLVLQFQIVLVDLYVLRLLACFNDSLNKLLKGKNIESKSPYQINKARDSIHSLALLYNDISNEIRRVNDINGLLILVIVLSLMLNVLTSIYYLIVFLISPTPKITSVLAQMMWCILHGTNFMILVEPGHRAESEITKMKLVLGKLTRKVVAQELTVELDMLYQLTRLNKASYAPMRACVLSRSLVVTIFSSMTTVLVVAVQYR